MVKTPSFPTLVRPQQASAVRWLVRVLGVVVLLLLAWRVAVVGLAEGYPASFWISQTLNGLVLGGVYALIALGYTLVYGILLMINFAHGDVMMIGGFTGFFALQLWIGMGWLEGSALWVVLALGWYWRGSRWSGWPTGRCGVRPVWCR